LVALVAVTALAGCSSGGSGSSTAAGSDDVASSTTTVIDVAAAEPEAAGSGPSERGSDPCALLAGVDLTGLLAEKPAEPEGSTVSCTVRAADESSHARLDLTVHVTGGADAYEQMSELLGTDAPVDGLGDEAIRTGSRILARSGDSSFSVQVVRNASTAPQLEGVDLVPVAFAIADVAGW
jgi:hypothetical protein